MEHYINKDVLVAEIERLRKHQRLDDRHDQGVLDGLHAIKNFIDTLKVKDPYEQTVQYDSIKAGIQAHAETYSFNIESELFNQLTPEQQKLWRKEIEQACISGGEAGIELARDTRYKENLEAKGIDIEQLNKLLNWWKEVTAKHSAYKAKEVDLEKEFDKCCKDYIFDDECEVYTAKHFFELGTKIQKGEKVCR